MKKILTILFLFFLLIYFTSCNPNRNNYQNPKEDKSVAAYINDSIITLKELDKSIQQELYDELNRIYTIRKVALEYKIIDKVFELEASKLGITVEEYINSYYNKRITDESLLSYIKKNDLESGIIELKRTLKYVNINSTDGEKLLYKEFKNYLKKQLVDSLRTYYNIKINLSQPQSSSFLLNDINFHYRGNLESKVTFLEISDIECSTCKNNFPLYEKIYEKYKDKVKFGFSHFSSYATLSAIACEYANKQGKFWEMHDSLFKLNHLDSSKIKNIAINMNLDLENYKLDFNDSLIISGLEDNFERIHSKGIYATPTIIINNRTVFNSASIEEIESKLIKELELIVN